MAGSPRARLTPGRAASPAAAPRRRFRAAPGWSRALRHRRVALGLAVVVGLYVVALAAPALAPHDPNAQALLERLRPPSAAHPFGTDSLGRDLLSRAIWGARVSLAVSLVATLLTLAVGAAVGLVAGFAGGWVDNAMMRVTDIFIAFPDFLLLITVIAIYGSSMALLIAFLGLAAWPYTARLVRAEVLSLRGREFVLAARVCGASDRRIMLTHLFPNVVPVLVVAGTLRVGGVILIEAGLSFFGLGVRPPTPTWGNMVADGRLYLDSAWWITTFPGALIVLTVLAYNLLGDGLRDALDPRRGRPDEW
ncbi:MAG TPA: ABC transporter permease [Thermomicrobiales bacterium]|nr:ABC transporter permease [Thermomicrobiales bacterium]